MSSHRQHFLLVEFASPNTLAASIPDGSLQPAPLRHPADSFTAKDSQLQGQGCQPFAAAAFLHVFLPSTALQTTLLIHADGSADLELTSIQPLVFVHRVEPREFFYPAKPKKLLVSKQPHRL